MNDNKQIEYWDSVASEKTFTTQLDVVHIAEELEAHSLIVDYGCGYGRTLNELRQKGYENLVGFDYSPNMIARGKRENPSLDQRVSLNNTIDCESNTVDLVIVFAVLTCMIDNEAQVKLVNEIERILKPNGLMYINDFLLNFDKRNTDRYDTFKDKYGTYGVFELSEGAVLRHHDMQWIAELTGNFEEKVNETVIHQTMNGNDARGIEYIGRKKPF